MKIALPSIVNMPNSSAHDYPFQIGYRAEKFVSGAIFYYSFVDMAVGQYVRQDTQALQKIQKAFIDTGLSEKAWETNWSCFEYYLQAFPSPVFQNALFSMVMHWDWYITSLSKFVEFARGHVQSPPLDKKGEAQLRRIGSTGVADQLNILTKATGLSFSFPPSVIASATELNLVRNLGMHNQWQVDARYLKHSINKVWGIGDVRVVTRADLGEWRDILSSLILETCVSIAKHYVAVPAYTET